VEVDTGLPRLGLDGSTALAACFGPSDLRDAVVGDAMGVCTARHSVIIHGIPPNRRRAKAAMAR
jgi:hypothetical protein